MRNGRETSQGSFLGGLTTLLVLTLVGQAAAFDYPIDGFANAGHPDFFNERAFRTGILPAGQYNVSISSGAISLGSFEGRLFNLTAISFRVGETGTIKHLGVLDPAPGEQYWDQVIRTPEEAFQAYLSSGNVSEEVTLTADGEFLFYLVDNLFGDAQYDNSGSLVVRLESCPVTVAFDFKPNTLNLRSMGRWVSAHLEPPAPYTPSDIDVASIQLNGTVPVDPAAPVTIADGNGNGVPDLKVKFDRAAVQATVAAGPAVPLEVTGSIGPTCFIGGDVARMIHAPVTAPGAGELVSHGLPTPIRWETPPGVETKWVAVLTSMNGGDSWDVVAEHLTDTGEYEWAAPYLTVPSARVAVVLVENELAEGEIEGVLGVGPLFSIGNSTAAGTAGSAFSLRATPNPARGAFRLSFTLPDARPATISLYDLAGRRVFAQDVGALGSGPHVLEIGRSAMLPTGVYRARLVREGEALETRVVFTR